MRTFGGYGADMDFIVTAAKAYLAAVHLTNAGALTVGAVAGASAPTGPRQSA